MRTGDGTSGDLLTHQPVWCFCVVWGGKSWAGWVPGEEGGGWGERLISMTEKRGGRRRKERPFVYCSFPGDVRLGIDQPSRSAVSVCDAISGGCHGFSFPIHGTVSSHIWWLWLGLGSGYSVSGLGLGCYFTGMEIIATVLPQWNQIQLSQCLQPALHDGGDLRGICPASFVCCSMLAGSGLRDGNV